MKRRRRGIEVFSMSFLDVVSCGFGAIILLLVIARQAEPVVIERISADLSAAVADLETRIHEMRGRSRTLDASLAETRAALDAEQAALAQAQGALARARGAFDEAGRDLEAQAIIEGRLADARQTLSEEMRRLSALGERRPRADAPIGGVPVDSEYIVFIIDTSGSMQAGAWPLVLEKVSETLAIYPRVKGIQVMNDMGAYMFSQYAGRWIPDTPARRGAILKRLRTWAPFSNSSPVEGITEAIRRFHAPDRRISLYVFGDEFSGASLEAVVQEVDRLNGGDARGERRVRIHGVGFPTQFVAGAAPATGIRFAALMRVLAERNGGTFVGLGATR